jgi:hypothetical protein
MKITCCALKAEVLEPNLFLETLSHKFRKKILHRLYVISLSRAITKKELAEQLGVKYDKLVYQLNKHLSEFWKVAYDKKKRGVREEYILANDVNTLYYLIGSNLTVLVMDPLANLFGMLSTVGTRCEMCGKEQSKKCFKITFKSIYNSNKELRKFRSFLELNQRKLPGTPVDYLLFCSASRALEGKKCIVRIPLENCNYLMQHYRKSSSL